MTKKSFFQDHVNKAEGYLTLGMYEDALGEASAALEIEPASYTANSLRGIAMISLERFDEARPALLEAIATEPERPETYIHLAYVDRRTVSLDKAIETIHKAIELKPDMPIANYNLACYCAVKGETDDALRYLGRAINIAPHFRETARADDDFESLRTNDRFRRLTEME